MPLSDNSRQAILAAYGRLAQGQQTDTGDTSFWRQFGLPPWRQRQLILDRAAALAQGAAEVFSPGFSGTLADAYAGTDYKLCGNRCGPAETETATVYGKAWFQDNKGRWTMRTYSKQFAWDTSIDTINRSMRSWAAAMSRKYGLSGGDFEESTLTLF